MLILENINRSSFPVCNLAQKCKETHVAKHLFEQVFPGILFLPAICSRFEVYKETMKTRPYSDGMSIMTEMTQTAASHEHCLRRKNIHAPETMAQLIPYSLSVKSLGTTGHGHLLIKFR